MKPEIQMVETVPPGDSRRAEPLGVNEESERLFSVRGEGFRIALHQDDCFRVLDALPEGSVDVVMTSPPYNLGTGYSLYDDTMPREEYLRWLGEWAEKVRRVLSPDGSLFFNIGSKPSDPWVGLQAAAAICGATEIAELHRAERFVLQNTIHWIKSISIDPENIGKSIELKEVLSVGHYKPINSERFLNDVHEYLFQFTKSGNVKLNRLGVGVPYQDKSNTTRWKAAGGDRRCRGNNWFIPYETIQSRSSDRPHPATFPVQLAEWAFRLHGLDRIRQVFDPFMGLGSTAVACLELGLSCEGSEIDPEYFRAACARLRQAAEQ